MTEANFILLCLALGLVAFLYSSVGHAGASGYIAVMTLFGLGQGEIKPTALVLNILAASVTSYHFWKAGHFSFRLFFPFAVISVPLAFLGGYLNLPATWVKILVGSVLLFSAARFLYDPRDVESPVEAKLRYAIISGGVIGLLSGITGTGGGIFLTPLMLLLRWARTKEAAAVSALFILCNSMAGLAGNFTATRRLPELIWIYAVVVLVGGWSGSYLGSNRYPVKWVKRSLALVLAIAGGKLILGSVVT